VQDQACDTCSASSTKVPMERFGVVAAKLNLVVVGGKKGCVRDEVP
jgi:hypothetical protein